MSGPGDRSNILYLTHNYPRHPADFSGRFIARLAAMIAQQYSRVHVLAPHDAGAALEETMDRVRVRRFRYAADANEALAYRGDWRSSSLFGPRGLWAHRRFFRAFDRETQRMIRELSPRLLHAHWWVPAGWIARRYRRDERPLIVTLHGTDVRLLRQKRWLRPLAGRVLARADLITTVSTWLADDIRTLYPRAADKIRVAPMPPDDAIFVPAATPRPANDPPLIVSVTRFTAQKRNDILIRALARLRDQGIRFCCRLIGDGGPLRQNIESLVTELGLTASVEFAGSITQTALAEEYRRADLVALTAVQEGFGMALVEAQLCGCAVVGVRSGGVTDIIEDGRTGLLARPDDPDDLAVVLEGALADSSQRPHLAASGMESARRQFSSEAIANRFIEWYKTLS
ncbi:MAG: glycosyltransferase family 4 protein [candidate division Zixibacteria bacterium]|nr:glycosyltransferase family 4 protein [candidate division Zixibacteria bacterium]